MQNWFIKPNLIFCGYFTPFSNVRPLLTVTFPKDSKSLKFLDIQPQEMGAKRPLNGTSKCEEKKTDRQTHMLTNQLIESIGPEGWCVEKFSEGHC